MKVTGIGNERWCTTNRNRFVVISKRFYYDPKVTHACEKSKASGYQADGIKDLKKTILKRDLCV